jgi:CBS domain-containing protein
MSRDPVTVDADLTVGRFMDEVAWSRRFTTYPVVTAGRAVGLLAFSSVASVPRAEWDTRQVRDAMTPLSSVLQLAEDTTAVEALTALSSPTTNRGLVVENGELVGLLSITDLARALEVRRRPQRAGAKVERQGQAERIARGRT